MLVGPVAIMGLIALTSDVRGRMSDREQVERVASPSLPPFVLAAVLSLLAAAIHLVVCPEHFNEAFIYGAFFAVATAAQVAWSFLVVRRPSHSLLLSGIVGNSALIAIWAMSRTVGIPIGPSAGQIEPVGFLDVVATACELGVVAAVAVALLRRSVTAAAVPQVSA
ncbi:MAG: hypothetical protein QOG53_1228 [Frankiales bacterium]|nr:hypothetical protein [Frankiales bacterium]